MVCANDLIAAGALQRLRQLGADVPGEVAVTGFDDVPLAGLADLALTTVRQPVAELAAEAARLLAHRPAAPSIPARGDRSVPSDSPRNWWYGGPVRRPAGPKTRARPLDRTRSAR
ncbi:substrate-binding domain-containing protein [Streptomyces albulus]|nr:substrate-binding domain-containing protein [Streptomyces noursei]